MLQRLSAFLDLLVFLLAYHPVPAAGLLDPPTISFAAGYATYLTGESVTLQCHHSASASGCKFYKDGRVIARLSGSGQETYRIQSVNSGIQGSYSCSYWTLLSGQEITSQQSHSLSLYVVENPATPHLSLEPQKSVYIRGESVTVKCTGPGMTRVSGYRFYKDGAEIPAIGGTPGNTHVILGIQSKAAGSYACMYWIQEPGRRLTSMKSSQSAIYVTDQPPAPVISYLPPFPVFIIRENVSVTCEAPNHISVSAYRFYHNGREVAQGLGTAGSTYIMHDVCQEQQGPYSCIYWMVHAGREVPSMESVPVQVYVTEPLLPPVFTLDPFDGRVIDGDAVTMRCMPRSRHMNLTAHFTIGQSEILYSVSLNGSYESASFSLQLTLGNNSGGKNYSCFYQADVRGRKLYSPSSRPELVTVQARLLLWPIITGVVLGFLFSVVLVLLLCWAVLPKKGCASSVGRETPAIPPPSKDETDLAYVSLTWSTLASSRSADTEGSTNEIFC